ncbi:hypothetical protein [Actinosynnema sp. NPDC020468]|uniref:hypothetical protein n=1 Tax=Actinosynnema sp. NPDC020468 TaxID=3154488 RepID=UPI0033E1102E
MVAIALQSVLPDQLAVRPQWLLPALSVLLLVALVILGPGAASTHHRHARKVSLALVAVVSAGNVLSAARLIRGIVAGTVGDQAAALLSAGAAIYLTNIVVFSLWYWEFDRGGPAARAAGTSPHPDLLFPQMTSPDLAPPDWEPAYVDYLYLSFTNATAFSPTDVMPLKTWAKLTMLVQSAVSLVLVTLVVARAVNILH